MLKAVVRDFPSTASFILFLAKTGVIIEMEKIMCSGVVGEILDGLLGNKLAIENTQEDLVLVF